jgi:hypothetical protein
MRKAAPSAHPHLRLVYSRPEPNETMRQRIIMAVPDPAPSIAGEWRHGTLDDFCDDIMRVAKEIFDAEPKD